MKEIEVYGYMYFVDKPDTNSANVFSSSSVPLNMPAGMAPSL